MLINGFRLLLTEIPYKQAKVELAKLENEKLKLGFRLLLTEIPYKPSTQFLLRHQASVRF